MIPKNRFSKFLHPQPLMLLICALPMLCLLIGLLLNYRAAPTKDVAVERESVNSRLQQFANAIDKQTLQLRDTARSISNLEGVVRFAKGDFSQPHLAIESLAQQKIETLSIASVTHEVRFSARVTRTQMVDQGLSLAIKNILLVDADNLVSTHYSDDQIIVICPIVSHSVPEMTLGHLILTQTIEGPFFGQAARQVNLKAVPAEIASALKNPATSGLGTSVYTHDKDASGYLILRDADGQAQWIFSQSIGGSNDISPTPIIFALVILLSCIVVVMVVIGIACVRQLLMRPESIDTRYKAIVDQNIDGVIVVDANTDQVQYINPSLLARLGYTADEAEILTLASIFFLADVPVQATLKKLQKAESLLAASMQYRCKNGVLIDIEVRCNVLDADGQHSVAYVTHDVSVRRKAEAQLIDNQQRLDRMAHHDQLTGLPNRHYLTDFLPGAINHAKTTQAMLGVVFLDLDRFKHINDTRGHEVGDKLLQEVARRLQACVREADVVIRMGGDEFVVVFCNVKTYEEVTQGAERIIGTLNQPIIVEGHALQTSGSVGVSLFPRDGADMGELLKHSDTAMYQAKDSGRNNVKMFSQIMNRKLTHRVAMEAALRDALKLKQLDVHFQPFVNLVTRKIVGLEALIRWNHPKHGFIPPDKFIPIAEESGLIVPLGNFVLDRTMQTLSAWSKAGVNLVPISLNIAPAQLQRGELQVAIATLLKTHNLSPSLLQLELTERAAFDNSRAMTGESRRDTLAALRDLGIKIAIDDFGTGYSSLSYLKNWRIDTLKIDKSFVRDLVSDSNDLAIVSAIIAIARHLQIEVIAEGIESYQQVEALTKLGCKGGQGFLFAKPMPADQCLKLLGQRGQNMQQIVGTLSVPRLELEVESDMLDFFASVGT